MDTSELPGWNGRYTLNWLGRLGIHTVEEFITFNPIIDLDKTQRTSRELEVIAQKRRIAKLFPELAPKIKPKIEPIGINNPLFSDIIDIQNQELSNEELRTIKKKK